MQLLAALKDMGQSIKLLFIYAVHPIVGLE
jgi:hypothetical protein